MAYSVVVAGGRLYRLSTSGVALPLALPAGITLSATRPPRFAVLGRNVLVSNNPLRSLCIGPDFSVRPMQLQPPVSPATLAGVGSGGLTGTYKVIFTHIVKDPLTGALLSESDYSPESAPATLVAALLSASGIAASPDAATTHFRLYRTLADGSVFYNWIDVSSSQSSVEDDLSDVLLPNLAAPRELGVGPGMLPGTYLTHLVEWKNRLWGVGDQDIDTVRYSGEGINYGWPATYGLDIKPIGGDDFGITGLMARRDLLGVGKRRAFYKISGGVTDDQGVPQWDVVQETNGAGVVGPNLVVGDTAYYLGADGFYTWGATGFACVSDNRVRRWFATDDYFNRQLFPQAFLKYNERYNTIELHLAAAGSPTINRWVSFDRVSGAWYGPHRTDKAGPTSGAELIDARDQALPVIGADDGVLYMQNQPGFSDAGRAIVIRLVTKRHDGNTPLIEKIFGAVSLVMKALGSAGRCLVRYRVGTLDADVTQTVAADLRLGTQTLPRGGKGQAMQLEITEDSDGLACELYGYEMPYFELSNRARR